MLATSVCNSRHGEVTFTIRRVSMKYTHLSTVLRYRIFCMKTSEKFRCFFFMNETITAAYRGGISQLTEIFK